MKYEDMSKERLIEELRKKEKENSLLIQKKQWIEKAENDANVMICHTDLKGNFIRVTSRFSDMLGYREEELLSKNISDIIHPEDTKQTLIKFQELIKKGVKTFNIENRYITKSGSKVCVFADYILVTNDEGEAIYVLAYLNDITERKTKECNIKRDAKIIKEINEQAIMYIKENEKLMFELRRFRHDTLNILYGLNGFIETKNWNGLKNYFSEIQEQVKVLKDSNPFSIEKVKNLAVRGLLTAKLVAAQKSHIIMHIEIDNDVKLDGRFIKNTDLCEILGIFLDNAIEAAGRAVNKKVSICVFEDDECISIIIENTYKDKPDLSRTKPKYLINSKEMGLGLKLSEKIIGQYKNVLHNTFVYQQAFIQELHILKK
jgi:two-component system sensor histidine kinase AgrC